MDAVKKILYITYDGLTDPLGQSQILPYLKGLSGYGYRFTILSFEKKDRMLKEEALIRKITSDAGIKWEPMPFTTRPPMVSKFYDALQMRRKAVALQKREGFSMVHCRSYISADVGLYLKKRFGIKFFFDMRGFWADEKKDGSWDVSKPLYRRIYQYYKAREAQYLQNADYIISLTHAGKKEMSRWPSFNPQVPLQVIPCCADMDHFSLTSAAQRQEGRQLVGLPEGALVISYLGSVGTWYMLEEMLELFRHIKAAYANAKFLFITHSAPEQIRKAAAAKGVDGNDLFIREASRKEVPLFVKASDINISFIKPVYSKISSSPTKLGEVLSMGIPVVCNSGVGDVEEVVTGAKAGYVVHDFSEKEFESVVQAIPGLLNVQPASIREKAEQIYSLKAGIERYRACYQTLFAASKA